MNLYQNNEKVSVAICTYCGERYITEQLTSIIQQTRPVQEIILSDDSSTDCTIELADSILSTSGIPYRIIRNQKNSGVTKNFETCISACSGNIVLTSDQDDLWKPNKVEMLLASFDDPKVVLAYSDAKIIDANGCELYPSLYRRDGFLPEPFTQRKYTDAVVRLSQTVYGCTMAFRKDFVSSIIPFYNSRANHDAWIMACAPLFGKIAFLPEPLISYRIHGENTVASIKGSSAWDDILAKQDEYDAHFAIQPLRSLRLDLLLEAVNRCGSRFRALYYRGSIHKSVRMYERLCKIKTHGKLYAAKELTVSLLDGSYRFRFCDRGVSQGKVKRFKQFVHDISFVMHR